MGSDHILRIANIRIKTAASIKRMEKKKEDTVHRKAKPFLTNSIFFYFEL